MKFMEFMEFIGFMGFMKTNVWAAVETRFIASVKELRGFVGAHYFAPKNQRMGNRRDAIYRVCKGMGG